MTEPAAGQRMRIKWPTEIKEAFSEAQNHRCPLCGKRMEANGVREDYPTWEHIVPFASGGVDTLDNLVITCRGCNESGALS